MRYGSLCSGIEAAGVAWHGLGWECAFTAEIDPFCRSVLAARHPHAPNLGDVATIDRIPDVDLLVGGTPCQPFSIQGLRRGAADGGGVLAYHFLRLAALGSAEVVVWENVPGVLSQDGGRPFGTFLGGLEELGYGWAYRILDARFFGGPHHRRRVFVVGCAGGRFDVAGRALFELEHAIEDPRQARKVRKTRASRDGAPHLCGVTGDETPKFIADASPTLRSGQGGEGNMVWYPADQWWRRRKLTARERERMLGFPDDYTLIEHNGEAASDAMRGNALGNTMDVRVMRWLGERIALAQEN